MSVAAPPRPPAAQRPAPAEEPREAAPAAPEGPHPDALLLPVVALVVAACLPLIRTFVGLAFLRPVLAAALLSLGVSWVSRRLGAGPLTALAASALAWLVFTSLAFLPDTLAYVLVPTLETLRAGQDLWMWGIELMRTRPAPAFAEAGILLIVATGVWWVAHAVDGLVFRLQAPLRAVAMALVLWGVPLAMLRDDATAWLWAAPVLGAAAWLLLVSGSGDLRRWGTLVRGRGATGQSQHPRRTGALIAAGAVLAGAALAGLLPGFGEPPYYRVERLGGGTTITTNPIVSIRANLVSPSASPVAQVRSPQPVYLRLTALEVFGEREEWTSEGIRGGAASGRLPFETDLPFYRELEVEVTAEGLDDAVLVPVPYQPMRLAGTAAERLHYDRRTGTVTVGAGHGLAAGEQYEVRAAIPDPDPEALANAPVGTADPALTALPGTVPEEVVALAQRIVDDAGADDPFSKALAIQEELRSWTYSLEPPEGHGRNAMRAFIESRVGYCEQFAGTMAVMLRSLGLPARVAVGYTPGDIIADDGEVQTYLVTRANAHAWVEMLFPGVGWVAFEPTPRDDGNVLTPSATNLAPTRLDADQDDPDSLGDLGQFDDLDDLVPQLEDVPLGEGETDAGGVAGDGADGGPPWARIAVLVTAAAVLVAVGLKRTRRGARAERLPPADRALAAMEDVRRVGRGLGLPARVWETDREYLLRLAKHSSADCRPAARTLAAAAARARYGTALPESLADDAEAAAGVVAERLLADTPSWRRALVGARGGLGERIGALRGLLRADVPDGAAQETPSRVNRLVTQR